MHKTSSNFAITSKADLHTHIKVYFLMKYTNGRSFQHAFGGDLHDEVDVFRIVLFGDDCLHSSIRRLAASYG